MIGTLPPPPPPFATLLYGREHWNPYPWKVYVALQMLYYFNSALNPFLFAFQNNAFKATYVKLLNFLKTCGGSEAKLLNHFQEHFLRDSNNRYQRGTFSAPGEGVTPLYKLYRYVPPQRVWFSSRFGLKTGIDFDQIFYRSCVNLQLFRSRSLAVIFDYFYFGP